MTSEYGGSFGMRTWRRLDSFREGKNPFTGEIIRFYDYHTTPEEREAMATAIEKNGIQFYEAMQEYSGTIDGTTIAIATPDVREHFVGTEINLSFPISDASLQALLEIATAGNLYFHAADEASVAAPTNHIADHLAATTEKSITPVFLPDDLRQWLKTHTT